VRPERVTRADTLLRAATERTSRPYIFLQKPTETSGKFWKVSISWRLLASLDLATIWGRCGNPHDNRFCPLFTVIARHFQTSSSIQHFPAATHSSPPDRAGRPPRNAEPDNSLLSGHAPTDSPRTARSARQDDPTTAPQRQATDSHHPQRTRATEPAAPEVKAHASAYRPAPRPAAPAAAGTLHATTTPPRPLPRTV